MTGQDLARLQGQLDRLVAREAIEDVVLAYARAHDLHDVDLLASCFAPDATFVFQGGQVYEGVDAILGCITPFFETSWIHSTHFMGRPVIDIDGETASVQTFCIAMLAEDPGSPSRRVLTRGITYTDRFVRLDGTWLIQTRRHEPQWMTQGQSFVPGSVIDSGRRPDR